MRVVNSSGTWLRIAVVYFALSVILGVVMGATGDRSLSPVHSHMSLLGWVTMTLVALIYSQYPRLADGRLAAVQFWLYQLGLAVLIVALAGLKLGMAGLEPLAGVASIVLGFAVVLFAANVFANTRLQPAV